jgi:hypothetical protein
MNLNIKGRGPETFVRVLLRAWQCDPREKIRFRVEIAGDQGVLVMNPRAKRLGRRRKCPIRTGDECAMFTYDFPGNEPEELLTDLASFIGSQRVRLRMISRPSDKEIALLNQMEMAGLAKFAAANDSNALLPFIFPENSEWRTDVFVSAGEGRFKRCPLWLSAAEAKRLLLALPDSTENLAAVRCSGLEVELPRTEKVCPAVPVSRLPKSPLQPPVDCPRCNGETELNGDGRLACHFCGHVFRPQTTIMSAAA